MGGEQSGELDNRAIWQLVDDHLVRAEKRAGATWFELSHDRLVTPVRRDNAAWFKANLSLLQRQADLWEQQGRPEGLLFGGDELKEAEQWASHNESDLLPTETDFLVACQVSEGRALRIKRRNQVISVLGVVAILLAIVAILTSITASNNAAEA
jgi:hypothetical protein